jgi:DNA-3-methyladenine glycosylase II
MGSQRDVPQADETMTQTAPTAAAADPHALAARALSERDPRLAALIARVGPCRLLPPSGLALSTPEAQVRVYFEGLLEAIVSQQLSPKAASTIFARVKAAASAPGGAPAFPDAASLLALPVETLRAAGLSGAKAASVRDLCERVHAGSLRLQELGSMDDEAIIQALSAVRGIGRWTAEMFLMFQLGRPDVLPVGDLGIQKGMVALFNLRKLPTPDRMRGLARPWQPYRSIACWYLWRLNEDTPRPPRALERGRPKPKPAAARKAH